MSQIFSRSANALAKSSLIGVLVLGGFATWVIFVLMRSDYVTAANESVEQPVQFSHLHHAGGMGIDCRYCHTSVESAGFAGIPPVKTCMNCHTQLFADQAYLEPVCVSYRTDLPIQWIRVHNLPDYVYFNHSVHLKKGVGCETCHGRVDRMPLTYQQSSLQMEWCLDCHRDPARFVRPRDAVFTMGYEPAEPQGTLGPRLVQEYGIQSLTSCSTCHR
jgi:hypothetical protein